MISEIKIIPRVAVKSDMQIQKAKELIAIAEKNCYISNSIRSAVKIMPEITTGVQNG